MASVKLKAKKDLVLEIVNRYDEVSDKPILEDLALDKGDIIELDIERETDETLSGQFPSGDMVYGLKKDSFDEIERIED